MKLMDKNWSDDEENKDLFDNEVNALSKVDHPNILKLIDYSNNKSVITEHNNVIDVCFIAVEYAENGQLLDYIFSTGCFSEPLARYFFYQLISALDHITAKGLSHQDIKPDNIMLDKDFNIKLADFGLATERKVSDKVLGTISYMAPELLAEVPHRTKSIDLFASAVILFMMLTQRLPFGKADPSDVTYKYIVTRDFDSFWDMHENNGTASVAVSNEFKDLFNNLVLLDDTERLTLVQVKTHPWYKGEIPSAQEVHNAFSDRKMVLEGKLKPEQIKKRVTIFTPAEEEKVKEQEIIDKLDKKHTDYFSCKDPEKLMALIIEFAEDKNITHKAWEEYFRVLLQAKKNDELTVIQINVLKKPVEMERLLQLICIEGDTAIFESIFDDLTKFLNANKYVLDL